MKTHAAAVRVDALRLALEMSTMVPPSIPAAAASPNAAGDIAEAALLKRAERIERCVLIRFSPIGARC